MKIAKLKKHFIKLLKKKYDVKNYNCKHESGAFAEVLIKNGAENVKLSPINHESCKSCKYSHVVVGDNNVYDPTSNPPFYAMTSEKYVSMIEKCGFNGMRVNRPYTKENRLI